MNPSFGSGATKKQVFVCVRHRQTHTLQDETSFQRALKLFRTGTSAGVESIKNNKEILGCLSFFPHSSGLAAG